MGEQSVLPEYAADMPLSSDRRALEYKHFLSFARLDFRLVCVVTYGARIATSSALISDGKGAARGAGKDLVEILLARVSSDKPAS